MPNHVRNFKDAIQVALQNENFKFKRVDELTRDEFETVLAVAIKGVVDAGLTAKR